MSRFVLPSFLPLRRTGNNSLPVSHLPLPLAVGNQSLCPAPPAPDVLLSFPSSCCCGVVGRTRVTSLWQFPTPGGTHRRGDLKIPLGLCEGHFKRNFSGITLNSPELILEGQIHGTKSCSDLCPLSPVGWSVTAQAAAQTEQGHAQNNTKPSFNNLIL